MIAYLKGQVIDFGEDHLVLETHGVGYQVFVTQNTLERAVRGETRELFIYTQIREDALQLFGFESKVQKAFFLALIKINGVGPKMAINILSAASVEHIRDLVDRGDVKGLTALPKVGKKTAEQIVLGLKGQLVFDDPKVAEPVGAKKEITFALCNLGFKASEVEKVVEQLDAKIEVAEGIRLGLRALSQN